MITTAQAVAAIRADYSPRESAASVVCQDLLAALKEADLPARIESRGGLTVCAVTPSDARIVVASEESLPERREVLQSWHVAHVPEDEPGAAWRCTVYDSKADASRIRADRDDLAIASLIAAVRAHLDACPRSVSGAVK
ncbi:hypothetical protein ACGFRG_05780 [Streptomyces sp. NPDC048696]|uniref:hypothetical protein n=1 Tax=Streptomyces sp. NPDC048696 TaxID=3365585 RepID=UPI003721180E